MIAFIVLFLPAVLSVWLWEKTKKTTLAKRNWFYLFTFNTVLINFICFATKKWLLKTGDAVIFSFAADMTPSVACNYLIMAIPLAVIIPFVPVAVRYIRAHVRFRIEPIEKVSENQNEE